MKRIPILILLALLTAFTAPAQDAVRPDHFRFKGIRIDGPAALFADSLSHCGFHAIDQGKPARVFKGQFAGVDDTVVRVHEKANFIWKVTVAFPLQDTWAQVKARYDRFKGAFADKYDVAPVSVERLTTKYKEGSGMEHWGFENGISVWQSIYDIPEGTVILSVRFDKKATKMYVGIDYIDRINAIVKEEIEMEDI